jgi:hypothetical protein
MQHGNRIPAAAPNVRHGGAYYFSHSSFDISPIWRVPGQLGSLEERDGSSNRLAQSDVRLFACLWSRNRSRILSMFLWMCAAVALVCIAGCVLRPALWGRCAQDVSGTSEGPVWP